MKKSKKRLGAIFLGSVIIPFCGIAYSEKIVEGFLQIPGEIYNVPEDLILAIKYTTIYIGISLGITFFKTLNR